MILRSHSFPFCLLLSKMALAASMLAGCCGASTDSVVQADSIVSDTVSTMADDSVHSVQAPYVYRDTIVGRFVKGVTDTLVIESGEMEGNPWEALEWTEHKLYSLGGCIDTLGLGTQFTVRIANVGDLDGNGSDELFLGLGAVSGPAMSIES